MKNFSLILLLCICLPMAAFAQAPEVAIQKGNELYKRQQYEPAASAYDEAIAKDPENKAARFNRASTAYRLAKPDEAIRSFEELAVKTSESGEKAKSYYNKGAILSNQKKLEESIDAYKNALRQDPNDKQARENLQKALLELKKKNPQKKEDQKKKQQQKQDKKQQPKMNQKEADQKLKLLEQKEKDLQEKMQKQKTKSTGGQKDW
ncbi:MAG: tetratricopeptide repeat protein [Chitinophagaceae bacterium]|nr:tetratricopeptide repeat protein [Chitinophagaceae bacterium]